MSRLLTSAVAAAGIMAFGAASADACPAHRQHARAQNVHNTHYTADYNYSQPSSYYGGQPSSYYGGYYNQPYGYSQSGWDNNWNYSGNTGVNTGFGFFGF